VSFCIDINYIEYDYYLFFRIRKHIILTLKIWESHIVFILVTTISELLQFKFEEKSIAKASHRKFDFREKWNSYKIHLFYYQLRHLTLLRHKAHYSL